MSNNKLNQQLIKKKIIETFHETLISEKFISNLLEFGEVEQLPIEITTGNHEVYKICHQGNAQTEISEDGVLFLFPESGIKEHCHPAKKGITETYTAMGTNLFSYQGKSCDFNECNLDEYHGVDTEDTNRIIYYNKINLLIKKQTTPMIKKREL